MAELNGKHSKEAKAIMGIWFGRFWTREDLLLFADTLEVGMDAKEDKRDITPDQRLIMRDTVNSIRARAL